MNTAADKPVRGDGRGTIRHDRDQGPDRSTGAITRAGGGAALRIVSLDPELKFAGGETQVLGLTLALTGAGHRAELLCDPAGRLWERARTAGIECHPLKIRNSVDAAAGLRLRKFLARNRYDVVHFHTARAHSLAPFARGLARALVVTRRMDYSPNRLFAPWLFNRVVDGVAAISSSVADALARSGVERERIAIIPSGVDCDRFRPPNEAERTEARARFELAPADIAIGTVGVLEMRKGHRFLLEAMALLLDRAQGQVQGRRLRCFIAGSGSLEEQLCSEIRRRKLDQRVRIIGAIDDARKLLWALDIFAMPSVKEGLGVAVLEAMACGLAVAASRTGGLAESVADNCTGILVPSGDAATLAHAIDRLCASAELRNSMGRAGRARVAEKFAIDNMARQTLELYRACLSERPAARR